MTPEPTIRSATPDDAATIHGFVHLLESHVHGEPDMPATVGDIAAALSARPPALNAELLERGGRPCAMATWYPVYSTSMGCGGIFVLDLYVDAAERGRGLGRRLLSHMAAMAQRRGDGFLKLEVDRSNDDAAAVYERLGFTASTSHPLLLTGAALARLVGRG